MIERKIQLSSNRTRHTILLRTISGKPLGQIPHNAIKTIEKSIDKPYEITLEIPRYYMDLINFKMETYPLYKEILNERQILLDFSEVYSIKSIEGENKETLTILAKSREVRLAEIDIDIEDCGFVFYRDDELDLQVNNKLDRIQEINHTLETSINSNDNSFLNIVELNKEKIRLNREISLLEKQIKAKNDADKSPDKIYSLNEYLYQETGWRIGTVTDSVRYDDKDEKIQTLRWQENIEKKWYDYIKEDLCEAFDCIVLFNTYEKTIDFLKEEELGDDIGLYLSKDNYITNLQKVSDSDKLVTRMKIIGNDEMDIIGSICTGSNYIEDYSYFMMNNEMSEELISALETYYDIVAKREKLWKKYVERKHEILRQKKVLATTFTDAEAQIYALNKVYETYHKPPNENVARGSQILKNITELQDKSTDARNRIEILDKELQDINKSIDNVVILCQKPTATDEHGELIFNRELLEELKEYIYTETYKNDSYLTDNVNELIEFSKRRLWDKSHPTYKWEISTVDFLERLQPIDILSWNGEIGLGDIVILYDKDINKEEFVYMIGYKHNVRDNEMDITLSNKKTTKENGLKIADYLTSAKNAMREIEAKRYLFIQQKYNRLNLPKEYIPKYREKERKRPDGIIID